MQCKLCVLGETYSASRKAGATGENCRNCGEYRETTKACTVTSKAVCGSCKSGAYAEGMLGLCKPCSPCCNDGKDIIIPECKVPGVPTSMQCSCLRSNKYSALVISSTSTTLSTLQPDQSTTQWQPSSSKTSTEVSSPESEPAVNLTREASPNVGIIAGSIIGGLVITILVIEHRIVMRERRKALSLRTGVVTVEDGAGREQNCEQGNGREVNRELVFLPNEDLYKGSLPPLPTPEVAGDKSPAKIGVQETASPLAGHNSSGKRMTF